MKRKQAGPAFELWYRNGKPHREDGPAAESTPGRKEWYRDEEKLTEAEFKALQRKQLEKEGLEISERMKQGSTAPVPLLKRLELRSAVAPKVPEEP